MKTPKQNAPPQKPSRGGEQRSQPVMSDQQRQKERQRILAELSDRASRKTSNRPPPVNKSQHLDAVEDRVAAKRLCTKAAISAGIGTRADDGKSRATRKNTERHPNSLANLRKGGGRAKGRPNKATAVLKAYAGRYTVEAIDSLVTIARDVEMPPAARVGAWREVLDRGNGKPPQALTGPEGEALGVPTSVAFVFAQQPGAVNRT